MYVSYCPELDVASCGTTRQKAKDNLAEVIEITITETKRMGTFDLISEYEEDSKTIERFI